MVICCLWCLIGITVSYTVFYYDMLCMMFYNDLRNMMFYSNLPYMVFYFITWCVIVFDLMMFVQCFALCGVGRNARQQRAPPTS